MPGSGWPRRCSRLRSAPPSTTPLARLRPRPLRPEARTPRRSTIRASSSLTVYNSDLALVRDVRALRAAARHLRPEVHGHRRHGEPGDGPLPLAQRAVARERAGAELRVRPARAREAAAQVRRPRRHAGAHRAGRRRDAEEEVTARLLSYNNAPVWQIDGEIVTGLHADHIRFPELPGNLYARPTLIWSLYEPGRHAPPRRGRVPGRRSCRGTPTTC